MINKAGYWKFTGDSLEFYDRSNEFIKTVNGDKLQQLSEVIGDEIGFNINTNKPGDIGINDCFKSNKDKELEAQEIEYRNNHCGECDRKLKKTVYRFESKLLCPYCYKKQNTNTLIDNLKITTVN